MNEFIVKRVKYKMDGQVLASEIKRERENEYEKENKRNMKE